MPASGDLIGPYRVVSLLGKGAMGEVWRARDERLDRYVALKVLPADHAGDLERRARMLREAKAAAAIKHPHVVTLFDILSADGDDILVMELVEGRTISDALRKDGRPSLEVALGWIVDIADGLTAAHAKGILHRDIKAANVMITAEGVKLLDFGLAKLADDAVAAATSMRLPAMAPGASATRIALDATTTWIQPAGSQAYSRFRNCEFLGRSVAAHHRADFLGRTFQRAPVVDVARKWRVDELEHETD